MQQGEAAHAAGDMGGFDTFEELKEGNELGGAPRGERKGRMRVGDANSDDDEDSDDSDGEGGDGQMGADLRDGDSEDDVDLYAAFESEEERGALANGVFPRCEVESGDAFAYMITFIMGLCSYDCKAEGSEELFQSERPLPKSYNDRFLDFATLLTCGIRCRWRYQV
jgi:hypothetical protein